MIVVVYFVGVDFLLFVGSVLFGDWIDLCGVVINLVEGVEEVNFINGIWSKSDFVV